MKEGAQEALEELLDEFREPALANARFARNHLRELRRAGELSCMRGPVLYNPFGGADVHTQLLLSPEVREVIATGKQRFGTITAFYAAMQDATVRLLLRTAAPMRTPYDTHNSLKEQEANYGGIGIRALSRLASLRCEDIRVEYLSLAPDGTCTAQQDPVDGKHARISFVHDGKEKSIAYFCVNLGEMDAVNASGAHPFVAYLGTRHIDSLLIKAAHTWWEGDFTSARVVPLALDRARECNARVFADESDNSLPRPIWKPGGAQRLQIDALAGYSSTWWGGEGKHLVTLPEARCNIGASYYLRK